VDLYTPPSYGSRLPQKPSVDDFPLATPHQKKELEIVIGYLLYYARVVDSRFLPATGFLSSYQSSPTVNNMLAMERLLQYASSHRHGCKTFHPSDMRLKSLTDASFNSRPKGASTAGSFHFLGTTSDPSF
jgi:hypothetical protein